MSTPKRRRTSAGRTGRFSPFVQPRTTPVKSCQKTIFKSPGRFRNTSFTEVQQQGKNPDQFFGNLLISCVYEDNPGDLQLYLSKGSNPNYVSDEGFSPLYLAVKFDLVQCAHLLLMFDAKMTTSSKIVPESPLELALSRPPYYRWNKSEGKSILDLFLQKLSSLEQLVDDYDEEEDEDYTPGEDDVPNENGTVHDDDEESEEEEESDDDRRPVKRQRKAVEIIEEELPMNGGSQSKPMEVLDEEKEEEYEEYVESSDGEEEEVIEISADSKDYEGFDEDFFMFFSIEDFRSYCRQKKIRVDFNSEDRQVYMLAIKEYYRRDSLWQVIMEQLISTSRKSQLAKTTSDVLKNAAKRIAHRYATYQTGEVNDDHIDKFVGFVKEAASKGKKEWWQLSNRELANLQTWEWFSKEKGKRTSNVSQFGLESLSGTGANPELAGHYLVQEQQKRNDK